MSEFLCEAGLPAHRIGKADFIFIDLPGKSVLAEEYELIHRLFPIPAGTPAVGRNVAQSQPDQLGGCVVIWEVPRVLMILCTLRSRCP